MAVVYPVSSQSPVKRVRISRLSISDQIQMIKEEIRIEMRRFRELIDAKERELLAEVDFLGDLQIIEKEELELELNNLIEGRTVFEKSNRIAAVEDTVRSALRELDLKIFDVQLKLQQHSAIKSSWQTFQLESSINSLCSLSNVTNVDSIYQSKSAPKWKVSIGEGVSQLSSPTSLAIQQRTDDVFVSDRDGNRIQVYNSLGEHIRIIDKKFKGPLNVFNVSHDSLFSIMTKDSGKVIIEFNFKTMNVRNIEFPEILGRDICIITSDPSNGIQWFYGCATSRPSLASPSKHGTDATSVVRFKDPGIISDPTSSCTLHSISKHLPYHSAPIGIATDGEYIYILIQNNKYRQLILKYSSDCEFIRSFLPSSLLSEAKSVCVDGRGNLLVAGGEGDSTKVLCLSPDGDLIHELILPHHNCVSVAVNSKFDVSILCSGDTYGLITL